MPNPICIQCRRELDDGQGHRAGCRIPHFEIAWALDAEATATAMLKE